MYVYMNAADTNHKAWKMAQNSNKIKRITSELLGYIIANTQGVLVCNEKFRLSIDRM